MFEELKKAIGFKTGLSDLNFLLRKAPMSFDDLDDDNYTPASYSIPIHNFKDKLEPKEPFSSKPPKQNKPPLNKQTSGDDASPLPKRRKVNNNPIGISGKKQSPGSAGIHTNTQLDNTKIPQKKLVVTQNGTQNKTVHVNGMDSADSGNKFKYSIPIVDKKRDNGYNPEPSSVDNKLPPSYLGKRLSKNEKENIANFYKNRINPDVRHTVYWQGGDLKDPNVKRNWISEFSHHHDDGKHFFVKRKNGGEPVKVKYHNISRVERPDDNDPGVVNTIKYPGEYHDLNNEKNDISDNNLKNNPEKKLSSEEHALERNKRQKLTLSRVKSLSENMQPGSTIEYSYVDPSTGKLKVGYGDVKELVDKNNSAIVNTSEGKVQVPLEDVVRFEQKMASGYYLHKFDPNKGKWVLDNGDISPNREDSSQEEIPENEKEPSQNSDANVKEKPEIDDNYYNDIISNAGLKIINQDGDEFTLLDPNTGRKFVKNRDEINKDNLDNLMGVEKKQEPKLPPWSKFDDPKALKITKNNINKIDEMRNEGIDIPSSILSARHNLLSQETPIDKAHKYQAEIQSFIDSPNSYINKQEDDDIEKPLNNTGISPVSDRAPEAFRGKYASSINSGDVNEVIRKKQGNLLDEIRKYAKNKGLPILDRYVDGIEPNKNNVKYLRYLTNFLSKTRGINLENNLPSQNSINDLNHSNELKQHLEREGLMNPYYHKRLEKLDNMIDNGADSKEIQSELNDIHHYAYERGENDPHFVAHALHQKINRPFDGKYLPPEEVEPLNDAYSSVNNGEEDPVKVNTRSRKLLFQNGISPMEDFKKYKNRTQNAKDDIFGKETDNLKPELVNNKELSPEEKKNKEIEKFKNSQKSSKEAIERQIENLNHYKEVGEGMTPEDKKTFDKMLFNLQNDIKNHNDNEAKNAEENGSEPKFIDNPFDEEKAKEAERNVQQYDQNQEMFKRHFKTNIEHYSERAGLIGHNFLLSSRKFDPKTQIDIRKLDNLMKQKVKSNDWTPIPEDDSRTEQGKAFVNKLNEVIKKVQYGEKIYGMAAEDAMKSLKIRDAEKALCRRDVSLALRKSFFDNKDHESITKATTIISTFFDKFIDNFFQEYNNIPLDAGKYIVRKLTKSIINDIIKDNAFVAENMSADFTCPLNDNIIKSMGEEVSAITTSFIIDSNPNKPLFYIDIKKSNAIEFDLNKSIKKLEPINFYTKLNKDEWLNKLIQLEDNMIKVHLFKNKVSKFRLKKFILDNDDKILTKFYNSNIEKLNRMLDMRQ